MEVALVRPNPKDYITVSHGLRKSTIEGWELRNANLYNLNTLGEILEDHHLGVSVDSSYEKRERESDGPVYENHVWATILYEGRRSEKVGHEFTTETSPERWNGKLQVRERFSDLLAEVFDTFHKHTEADLPRDTLLGTFESIRNEEQPYNLRLPSVKEAL